MFLSMAEGLSDIFSLSSFFVTAGFLCTIFKIRMRFSVSVPTHPSTHLSKFTGLKQVTEKLPSVRKTGAGSPASRMSALILGTPEPIFSTNFARASKPKMSGLRLWLRFPNCAIGIALTSPPGLLISIRRRFHP